MDREVIPGLAGLTVSDEPEPTDLSHLKTIYNKVKANDHAWPFEEPVDQAEVPEYYTNILFPIDLKTIGERMKNGYYVHVSLITVVNQVT